MRAIAKNMHYVAVVLILVVLGIHLLVVHSLFAFSWTAAVIDSACGSIELSLGVWCMILLLKAYPTKVTLYAYSLVLALVFALATIFGQWEVTRYFFRGIDDTAHYLDWLYTTLPVRFIIFWIFYSWVATNSALRRNIRDMESRFQMQADATVLLKDAELFKLRQQLQPHFLYNSLNSINALVMISPDRAQEMVGKLSDFLRDSVKRETEVLIPLAEELELVENYLAIESIRFGDRLCVDIEKDFAASNTIPPFLLQPLIENAIKFGLYGNTGKVTISMEIQYAEPILEIRITNPFDPNMQPPSGTGFGLQGVRRRLFLLFARADLLETSKEDNYFTTILKIPQAYV